MKRLAIQFIFWSWIASVLIAMFAIYAASWGWTLLLLGYSAVCLAISGFIKFASKPRSPSNSGQE